jgi:hypothetical protein
MWSWPAASVPRRLQISIDEKQVLCALIGRNDRASAAAKGPSSLRQGNNGNSTEPGLLGTPARWASQAAITLCPVPDATNAACKGRAAAAGFECAPVSIIRF